MSKRDEILDVAQTLIQQRGFNGFSYADIAEQVGIRKASIHHHFPNKLDLAMALITNYTEQVKAIMQRFSQQESSAEGRLRAYIDLYVQTLAANRVCMGGMLASDIYTLDDSVRPALIAFFDAGREWLVEVLTAGQKAGEIRNDQSPHAQADTVLSSLQGGLMLARSHNDPSLLKNTADILITNLRPLH